jgi:Cu(I)/Ag(I) efflux system periplasmic protein CusF
MKHLFAISAAVAVLAGASPFAIAQSDGMKGMDMDKKVQGKTHKGAGTVQKVDPAGGSVTIAHGPIESMKWPSMTMSFKAKKAMLQKVKPGDQVQFSFVQSGKDHTITEIK